MCWNTVLHHVQPDQPKLVQQASASGLNGTPKDVFIFSAHLFKIERGWQLIFNYPCIRVNVLTHLQVLVKESSISPVQQLVVFTPLFA